MAAEKRMSAIKILSAAFFFSAFAADPAHSFSLSGGRLTEDFTQLGSADLARSTGLWNIVSRRAQAARVADGGGGSLRPIRFGDGGDGALDTAGGYAFDTDQKPNGYDFTSVNITGGAVTVTGTHPLVIRSLGAVTITPTIQLSGSAGSNGLANAASTAPAGGTAIACPTNGGAGGTASAGGVGDGGDGFVYTGATDFSGGTGEIDAVTNPGGDDGSSTTFFPGNNFDSANVFICGGGGGGGGGRRNTGTLQYATGGGGGAGGGTIRIAAVGTITVGSIQAAGGNGGDGVSNDGANCSGAGAGGHGGAVWLQTLADIPLTIPAPVVAAGAGGTSVCGGLGASGNAGKIRLDSSGGNRPAHSNVPDFDTDLSFPSQSSSVFSKAYDLGTLNAKFSGATVSQTANGGNISISYAGSIDNSRFSDYVADITQLNDKNYRYLKIKMDFTTAAAAAAPPEISRIVVDFTDAGLSKVDFKLSAGCGSVRDANSNSGQNLGNWLLFWGLLLIAYLAGRGKFLPFRP